MDLEILNSNFLIHKHSVECLHSNQTDEITDIDVNWAVREWIHQQIPTACTLQCKDCAGQSL